MIWYDEYTHGFHNIIVTFFKSSNISNDMQNIFHNINASTHVVLDGESLYLLYWPTIFYKHSITAAY